MLVSGASNFSEIKETQLTTPSPPSFPPDCQGSCRIVGMVQDSPFSRNDSKEIRELQ